MGARDLPVSDNRYSKNGASLALTERWLVEILL